MTKKEFYRHNEASCVVSREVICKYQLRSHKQLLRCRKAFYKGMLILHNKSLLFKHLHSFKIYKFSPISYPCYRPQAAMGSYQRALIANGLVSALRLHQRLPHFQFNREYLGLLLLEDSCHNLLYSLIFANSYPITCILFTSVI